MARLRLGYTKSRTGCTRCKQRRVKCDEKRPCGACTRHSLTCSLVATTNTSPSGEPLPTETRQYSTHKRPSRNHTPQRNGDGAFSLLDSSSAALLASLPSNSPSPPSTTPPGPLSCLSRFTISDGAESPQKITWVVDLELMHHYSATTSLTFPRANEIGHIWQIELVQLAFTNEPLLHQILAVSAFHLAYLHPDRRHTYSLLASQHQSDAAKGLRTGLTQITSENCHALFAAGSLLTISGFAALAIHQENVEGPRPTVEDLVDVFILTRGLHVVLKSFEGILQQGRFADLFKISTYTAPMGFLEALCEKLDQLRLKLKDEGDRVTAILVDLEICKFVEGIKECIKTAPIPELRVTMTWPMILSEDFLTLLRQKNPMALALFIYYCTVIRQSESNAWYIRGWSLSVARDIKKNIPSTWREAIIWPLQIMGIDADDVMTGIEASPEQKNQERL